LLLAPQRAWANLLLGNFFFVSLALYGPVFVALTYLFSGGWAVAFRRVPEAMGAYLPIGGGIMVLLLLGAPQLYAWAQPTTGIPDPGLHARAAYLNLPFFALRLVLAFGVWIVFSYLLRRHSQQQDLDGNLAHTRKNQTLSAGFLLLFAITFIFTSFDWIMSLAEGWYSTIFPAYTFAGLLLGGTAALLILVICFRERGLLTGVTSHHLYELARLLCATSTFWAYIWFCQYMLIYYTNIPEEAVYYAHWRIGYWALLFPLNLALNWAIPLLLLIPVPLRRSPRWLLRVSGGVLVGRWLDLFLLIFPNLDQPWRFGLLEVLIPLGFLPLFVWPLIRTFRQAHPLPQRDPYLGESLGLRV